MKSRVKYLIVILVFVVGIVLSLDVPKKIFRSMDNVSYYDLDEGIGVCNAETTYDEGVTYYVKTADTPIYSDETLETTTENTLDVCTRVVVYCGKVVSEDENAYLISNYKNAYVSSNNLTKDLSTTSCTGSIPMEKDAITYDEDVQLTTTPAESFDKLYADKGGSVTVSVTGMTNIKSHSELKVNLITGTTVEVSNQAAITEALERNEAAYAKVRAGEEIDPSEAEVEVPAKVYSNLTTSSQYTKEYEYSTGSDSLDFTATLSFNTLPKGTYTVVIDARDTTITKTFTVADVYTDFAASMEKVNTYNTGDYADELYNNVVHTWRITISDDATQTININPVNDNFSVKVYQEETDYTSYFDVVKDVENNTIDVKNKVTTSTIVTPGTYNVSVTYTDAENTNTPITKELSSTIVVTGSLKTKSSTLTQKAYEISNDELVELAGNGILYNNVGIINYNINLYGYAAENYPETTNTEATAYTSENAGVIYKLYKEGEEDYELVYDSTQNYTDSVSINSSNYVVSPYGLGVYNKSIVANDNRTISNALQVLYAPELLDNETTSSYNYIGSYFLEIHIGEDEEDVYFYISDESVDYKVNNSSNSVLPSNTKDNTNINVTMKKGNTVINDINKNEVYVRIFDNKVIYDEDDLLYYKDVNSVIEIVKFINEEDNKRIQFRETIGGTTSDVIEMSLVSFYSKYYSDFYSNANDLVDKLLSKYVFDEQGNIDLTQDNLGINITNVAENLSVITIDDEPVVYENMLAQYPEITFDLVNLFVIENNNIKTGFIKATYRSNDEVEEHEYNTNQFNDSDIKFLVDFDEDTNTLSIVPSTEVPYGTYYVYVDVSDLGTIGYINNGSVFTREGSPELFGRNIRMTEISFDKPSYAFETDPVVINNNVNSTSSLYKNIDGTVTIPVSYNNIYDAEGFSVTVTNSSNEDVTENFSIETNLDVENKNIVLTYNSSNLLDAGAYNVVITYSNEVNGLDGTTDTITVTDDENTFTIADTYVGVVAHNISDVPFVYNIEDERVYYYKTLNVDDFSKVTFEVVYQDDTPVVYTTTLDDGETNKGTISDGTTTYFTYETSVDDTYLFIGENAANTTTLYSIKLTNVYKVSPIGDYKINVYYDNTKVTEDTFSVGNSVYLINVSDPQVTFTSEGESIDLTVTTDAIPEEEGITFTIFYKNPSTGELENINMYDELWFDASFDGSKVTIIPTEYADENGEYSVRVFLESDDSVGQTVTISSSTDENHPTLKSWFDWSAEYNIQVNGEAVERFYRNLNNLTINATLESDYQRDINWKVVATTDADNFLNATNYNNKFEGTQAANLLTLAYQGELDEGEYTLVLYYNSSDYKTYAFTVYGDYVEGTPGLLIINDLVANQETTYADKDNMSFTLSLTDLSKTDYAANYEDLDVVVSYSNNELVPTSYYNVVNNEDGTFTITLVPFKFSVGTYKAYVTYTNNEITTSSNKVDLTIDTHAAFEVTEESITPNEEYYYNQTEVYDADGFDFGLKFTFGIENADVDNLSLDIYSSNTLVNTIDSEFSYSEGVYSITKEDISLDAGTYVFKLSYNGYVYYSKTIVVSEFKSITNVAVLFNGEAPVADANQNLSIEIPLAGGDVTLTFEVTPEDATVQEVSIGTANTSVFNISGNILTPIGAGEALFIITDIKGEYHGSITVIVTDGSQGPEDPEEITVKEGITNYVIDSESEDKTITFASIGDDVTTGTTIEDFLANLENVDNVVIKNGNGEVVEDTSENIGTGYTITCGENTYVVVVMGDNDGDGEVTSTDLLYTRLHLLGSRLLTGCYEKATNITADEEIDSLDLLYIRLHLLGTRTITVVEGGV